MTTPNRRKISNAVIDSKAQLRAFVPLLILFLWSFGTILMIYRRVLSFIGEFSLEGGDVQARVSMADLSNQVSNLAVIGICGMAILSVSLWIIFSHRIFGPMVPIQRQVDKLIDGSYEGEIQLRKHDEFKDLAAGVNELTRALKERSESRAGL